MDYEKKYNELVGKIKKAYLYAQTGSTKAVMEDILPELRESEDERVRKGLIKAVSGTFEGNTLFGTDVTREEALAWLEKQETVGEIVERCKTSWYNEGKIQGQIEGLSDEEKYQQGWHDALEKQGEQMPTDKIEPKFEDGDWVVDKNGVVKQILSYNNGVYKHTDGYSATIFEDEWRLWDITKDAKDGDVLNDENSIFIFKDLLSDNSVVTYCDYDIDCNESDAFCSLPMDLMCSKITPATKEQRDLLFQKMEEAGYMWDANKKELKKIEQKSTDKDETKFHEGECISNNKKDEPKEDNRTVTERIKTFKDACDALGDEHPFVTQYRLTAAAYKGDPMTEDFIAYLKLRIIVTALNEGWEPKFETDEHRYYPWFYLYTKEQYDELDIKEKEHCVLRSGNSASSYYGFMYVVAYDDTTVSNTSNGSRLTFRTRELAAYAGRQFTEEWVDFVFKSENL